VVFGQPAGGGFGQPQQPHTDSNPDSRDTDNNPDSRTDNRRNSRRTDNARTTTGIGQQPQQQPDNGQQPYGQQPGFGVNQGYPQAQNPFAPPQQDSSRTPRRYGAQAAAVGAGQLFGFPISKLS